MKTLFFCRLGLWLAFSAAYPGESIWEWQFGVMCLAMLIMGTICHYEGTMLGVSKTVEAMRKSINATLGERKP